MSTSSTENLATDIDSGEVLSMWQVTSLHCRRSARLQEIRKSSARLAGQRVLADRHYISVADDRCAGFARAAAKETP